MISATRTRSILVFLTLMLSALTATTRAESSDGTNDAASIMGKVFQAATEGKRATTMEMVVTDGGQERLRTMKARSMRVKDARKSFVLIDNPADVRGVALLSVDYDDPRREGERWLYLPNLGRSTRITNGQMSGAFMGSDLSYGDMSQPNPKLFQFTITKPSEVVDGEDCWVISGKPVDAEAEQQIGYTSFEVWVSKSKLVAIRVRAQLVGGKKTKYIKASEFKQIGKYWVPHRTEARTVEGEKLLSKTVLITASASTADDAASDDDFTKRRLEQGL